MLSQFGRHFCLPLNQVLYGKVVIEDLKAEDFDELLVIFNSARKQTHGLPPEAVTANEFKALIAGECIHIAKVEKRSVGFVSVWPEENFLHHLYVLPEYQKKGVGIALIRKCTEEYGLPLRLKCAKRNLKACRFYDESGWVRESEHIDDSEGPYINYRLGGV